MKMIIAILISTLFLSVPAFAQDSEVKDLTDIDALPDITELPSLDLSDPGTGEPQAIDITRDFPAAKTIKTTSSSALLDEIPDAQKDLIERLKYKKKEGSKIKRYKPEFGIRATNIEIGASQKE